MILLGEGIPFYRNFFIIKGGERGEKDKRLIYISSFFFN